MSVGRFIVGKSLYWNTLMWLAMVGYPAMALWPKPDIEVTHFAFGGCNFQRMPQSHWPTIAKTKPQFWIWNGDAIYADPFDITGRANEFAALKSNSSYAQFIKAVPILGVWDDHDFGADGADGSVTDKPARQKMYLDFVDEPTSSPRWAQDGIYGSWLIGPPGKRTKVVLLDVRWFRQQPGKTSTLLGKDQWNWFEKEVTAADYEFLVVVSGTQMIPKDHSSDKWMNYPAERQRLLSVLESSAVPVFLISGDRHFAELSSVNLANGSSVYEATASGLTHSTFSSSSKNTLRVGKWIPKRNYGLMDLEWSATGLKSATVRLMEVSGKEVFSKTVAP
jgi:alkaline phosphatase D